MDKLIPLIPIRDGVIFPNTDSVLTFGRPKSLAALESSFSSERIVCFVLQKNSKLNDPTPSALYSIGTISRIERMTRTEGEIIAQVRGISRVRIKSIIEEGSYLMA
jgi:ATP-dependent Lon protease